MNITTVCPACKSQFHIDKSYIGKAQACPACKGMFVVESVDLSRYSNPQGQPAFPLPDPGIAAALAFILPSLGGFYARMPWVAAGAFAIELVFFALGYKFPADPNAAFIIVWIRIAWASYHLLSAILIYFDTSSAYRQKL